MTTLLLSTKHCLLSLPMSFNIQNVNTPNDGFELKQMTSFDIDYRVVKTSYEYNSSLLRSALLILY